MKSPILKLGVNIDHVATLREARYRGCPSGEPNPVDAALLCIESGAHGITAHLREDRRHIVDRDIVGLRKALSCRFNLEMANVPEILEIALDTLPDIVCIVPEKREELTTEGGLDVSEQKAHLSSSIQRLNKAGIEVSLFVDPDLEQIRASHEVGAQFIELHTGSFAEHFHDPLKKAEELERLVQGSTLAHDLGLRVNAGHGLNYENLLDLLVVPHMEELNIGHSIVSRAVLTGLGKAVRDMLKLMEGYKG